MKIKTDSQSVLYNATVYIIYNAHLNNIDLTYIGLIAITGVASAALESAFHRYLKVIVMKQVLVFLTAGVTVLVALTTDLLPSVLRWDTRYSSKSLACVFMPIFLMHIFTTMDLVTFFKNIHVSIITSVLTVCFGFLIGYTINFLYPDISTQSLFFLGACMTTIHPTDMIAFLISNDNYKHVAVDLKVECIVSLFFTLPIVNYLVRISNTDEESILRSIELVFFLLGPVLGIIAGWITAKAITLIMKHSILNVEVIFGLFVGGCMLLYLLAARLNMSGYAASLTFCMVISGEKDLIIGMYEKHVTSLLHVVHEILHTAILFRLTVQGMIFTFTARDMDNYFYSFIILTTLRILVALCVYPLAKKLYGDGIVYVYLIAIVSPSCIFSLLIACELYETTNEHGQYAYAHSIFNIGASMLLNNIVCVNFLKWSHIGYISEGRIVNMEHILYHLKYHRDEEIIRTKFDRTYSAVNWNVVYKYAQVTLGYPYPPPKKALDWAHLRDHELREWDVQACCIGDCPLLNKSERVIYKSYGHYKKNMIFSMLNILKRMHEHCFIDDDCERTLQTVVRLYESEDPELPMKVLKQQTKTKPILKFLKKVCKYLLHRKENLVPRKKCYRLCYFIRTNKVYQASIYIFATTCVVPTIIKLLVGPELIEGIEQPLYITLAAFFFLEFVITIYSYSFIKVTDGLRVYFTSFWYIVDFVSLIGIMMDCVLVSGGFIRESRWARGVTWLAVLRSFRLFRFFTLWLPILLNFLQYGIDKRLETAFMSVLALNDCINEMILYIERWDVHLKIKRHLILALRSDKASLHNYLIKLEVNSSNNLRSVKTKTMSRAGRCFLSDYLGKLKFEGKLETDEIQILRNIIIEKKAQVESITVIPSVNPTSLFHNVYWVATNQSAAELLKSRAELMKWSAFHVLTTKGEPVNGIYILVSGHMRIVQRPHIPISINAPHEYEEFENDFILQGNSIGEIELLTGKPYTYTIVCNVDCRTYFIDLGTLVEAMMLSGHPIEGLEATLWKRKMLQFCTRILMQQQMYRHFDVWDIKKLVQRAFVPDLRCYKRIVFTDAIRDIILVDGQVMDFFTKRVYTAPCYIPRTVEHFVLEQSKKHKIEGANIYNVTSVKLFIIPTGDLEPHEVLARIEGTSVLIKHNFAMCPYHVTRTKGRLATQRQDETNIPSNLKLSSHLTTNITSVQHAVRTSEKHGSEIMVGASLATIKT